MHSQLPLAYTRLATILATQFIVVRKNFINKDLQSTTTAFHGGNTGSNPVRVANANPPGELAQIKDLRQKSEKPGGRLASFHFAA